MEMIVMALFCIELLVCVILKMSVLVALLIGLAIFFVYTLLKGFSVSETIQMCVEGIVTAKTILITFLIIGVLTGMWRAAGTIPTIICYSSSLFSPAVFLLITFVLNCLVSFLTGTSFGTTATMGVICATIGRTMHMPPALFGGAVLAGAFFGDRCSPVSTSALLVSELTKTDIFSNIKNMLKIAAVPFVLSCIIYTVLGFMFRSGDVIMDINALFRQEFVINPIALLPAAAVLILSFLHVKVKKTLLVSIAFAIPICLFVQKQSVMEVLRYAFLGYEAGTAELSGMINGGGFISMVRATIIVMVSAAYSGIFKKTGILLSIQNKLAAASQYITPFGSTLLAAIITGMISCNQTLSIMLTKQLCSDLEPDKEAFAIYLEDTAVVIPPLIPWSIAGAVPLAMVDAPMAGIFAACFLYLTPIWHLFLAFRRKKRV